MSVPTATPPSVEPRPVLTDPPRFPLSVTTSAYGEIAVRTGPHAECSVEVDAPAGRLSDGPPRRVEGSADAAGDLTLSYPAPFVPGSRGSHLVTCGDGTASRTERAPFAVRPRAISAAAFTVRLTVAAPPDDVVASVPEDPALMPLRDDVLERLRADLAAEWRLATRGLGKLQLVEGSADIGVRVVAARGTSVHLTAADGSQAVVLFVADRLGPVSPANMIATALHELGHIWCCEGPGTVDGHWAVKEEATELGGVDRFGLMNHPIDCVQLPVGVLSCPTRFSERELRAMGFTAIPIPPPDPCLVRADELDRRIGELDARMRPLGERIAADRATIDGLRQEIEDLEARYPSPMPPEVYAGYVDLIERHNALAAKSSADVAAYNALARDRNGLVTERNGLGC